MQINPLLLMLLIVVLITVVGKVLSWLGTMLGDLEKQARERLQEAERQRRAMQAQGGAPPRPRNPQEELEQMFALLTGQAPARRTPPAGRAQPAARRPAPPPAPPARPTRKRVSRAADEGDPETGLGEGEGGSEEGTHGGGLADHHLHSRVEAEHLRSKVEGKHLQSRVQGKRLQPGGAPARDTSLSGADAAADSAVSGGAQAAAEGAGRMTVWLDSLPPLARGLLWSELLGPPGIKRGPRIGPSARRV